MTSNKSTVDTQEINKFSQHANDWWETDGPLKTLHDINPARLAFINQHITMDGLDVLDLGCGGGILCEAMARNTAIVTGIDAEKEAIETAKAHAKVSQLDISYFCTPVEQYGDKSFDVITCMELLEHVTNPALIIQHCQRLLKPGGLLFVSTLSRTLKAYATAIVAAEYLLDLLPRQTHDYDKFIRPSELASMLRACDFEIIDLQGLAYNPLTRTASLCADVSVNYLYCARLH